MKLYQIALLALFIVSILPASLATSPMMPCSECNELGYSLCASKFQTTDVYNLPECRSIIDKCYASCREKDPYKCGSLSRYDCGGKYWDCIAIRQESGYIKYGEEKKIGDLGIRLDELREKTCPPNADCSYVSVIQGNFVINRQLESIAIDLNGERKFETGGKLYLLKFNGLYEIANGIIGIIGEPTSTEPSTRLDRKSALSASVLVYNLGSVSEREKRSQCFDQVISCFNDCPQNIPKQCTAEARVCLDGSSVGRDPYNNCEFKNCPSVVPACQEDEPKRCTDGNYVYRDSYNNCEFPSCQAVSCSNCEQAYDSCIKLAKLIEMTPEETRVKAVKDLIAGCDRTYEECSKSCTARPVCDAGCYVDIMNKCVPVGTRLSWSQIAMIEMVGPDHYCGIDGELKPQKNDGEEAQNSYECLSNFQSDGKCVSVSENLNILQKILKWFSKIFGGN